jgi:3-hydroxybutyryl-CoA dehydratase
MRIGKTIYELRLGDFAEFAKTLAESDIYLYAGLPGDLDPAHLDEEYAKKTFFKARIAQGMLTAGLISGLIGAQLPGPGTIYISQEVHFLAPVYISDTITARAEVIHMNTEDNRVKLKTTCVNQAATTVVEGEALVSPAKASGEI